MRASEKPEATIIPVIISSSSRADANRLVKARFSRVPSNLMTPSHLKQGDTGQPVSCLYGSHLGAVKCRYSWAMTSGDHPSA